MAFVHGAVVVAIFVLVIGIYYGSMATAVAAIVLGCLGLLFIYFERKRGWLRGPPFDRSK